VILADVDCIFGCLCNPRTSQIWCFTYPEEWEFVACLQVTSVAIKCDANFKNRPFIVPQRIANESHFNIATWNIFDRRSRSLSEIFDLKRTDDIAARSIFSGR